MTAWKTFTLQSMGHEIINTFRRQHSPHNDSPFIGVVGIYVYDSCLWIAFSTINERQRWMEAFYQRLAQYVWGNCWLWLTRFNRRFKWVSVGNWEYECELLKAQVTNRKPILVRAFKPKLRCREHFELQSERRESNHTFPLAQKHLQTCTLRRTTFHSKRNNPEAW